MAHLFPVHVVCRPGATEAVKHEASAERREVRNHRISGGSRARRSHGSLDLLPHITGHLGDLFVRRACSNETNMGEFKDIGISKATNNAHVNR